MIQRKKVIVGAAVVILLGALVSVGIVAGLVRAPKSDVIAAGNGIDNATNSVLSICMKTLPKGSATCDNGVEQIKTNCDTMFKVPPDSCKDSRISDYIQARAMYNATHLAS